MATPLPVLQPFILNMHVLHPVDAVTSASRLPSNAPISPNQLRHPTPAAARSALLLPTAALLAAAIAPLLLPATYRADGGCPLPPAAVLAAAWRASVLCTFVWTMGGHLLEIVFTEPVAFGRDDSLDSARALLAALRHPDPLVQVSEGLAAGC